ncbi:putative transcriptional regulator YheO [Arthrobacter silviterrae]|uniref:Transcriptional regulator n=1 Tax=Arthrobacter silviterrae TaxID=2026658 RepID=A0ABX0DBD0_9MICC|nr:PAS domain-containing protein [Arthrobacter silviterrae]MDQ0275958.1 putative transcriptional regulator YheO [Arthrobacter silviterrae]NGN84208.1 transcriptional regulator [Arthrobacter silviterrae]
MTEDFMAASAAPAGVDQLAHMGTYESVADILVVFRPVMHAMAAAAGPGCEVVLHDLSAPNPDLRHTIAAIENGHVTGREIGGPSSSLGASVIHNQSADHNAFGYRGITSDGRQLRCSSVYFRNAAGRIIAALCINVDVSAIHQARAILGGLLPQEAASFPEQPNEYFGRDLVSVMDVMIAEAIREVGKPVGQMSRDDRIAVLTTLDQQGVLQMRKGIERIAARLDISRVTAYSYLDEARSQGLDPAAAAAER